MQGYVLLKSMPGSIGDKVQSGGFFIYDALATLEEAKLECESQNYQLVIIDSPAKLHEVEEALIKDSKYYTTSDKFWTGGYLNISMGKTPSRNFEWYGISNGTTPYSKELFKQFSIAQLDLAIENRVESLNVFCKDQVNRDYCVERENLLYVGLLHPKTKRGTSSRGLTILNAYGHYLSHDDDNYYVMCEKKSMI